jgi:inner membrane transporter RhtA
VALLPATATVIGVIVLQQLPTAGDVVGIVLVMVGVALHQPEATGRRAKPQRPLGSTARTA